MFGKKKSSSQRETELRCSFCNKTENPRRKVIAGPKVQICDECVDLCVDILNDDRKDPTWTDVPGAVHCMVCRMQALPEDVVMVRSRGVICRGCIGEIQAAVGHERDDS